MTVSNAMFVNKRQDDDGFAKICTFSYDFKSLLYICVVYIYIYIYIYLYSFMVVYKSHIYHVYLIYTIISGKKKHEYVTRLIALLLTTIYTILFVALVTFSVIFTSLRP